MVRLVRSTAIAALALAASSVFAQSPASLPAQQPKTFEVAEIKRVEPGEKAARFIVMQGTHRFVVKDYTLKLLIAAAYDLNPRTIYGGPAWVSSDHYNITAITPGEIRPSRDQQMAMLRSLLHERFKLALHRKQKEFSIYELEVAKGGSKLKASTAAADQPPALISVVYPQKVVLPARNATMGEFASLLQRAVLDRPVVDKTGLAGRYDFDLEWAPDETQFGGEIPAASADAPSPPFPTAIQQQLGLKIEAARGPIAALVVDNADRPSEN